MYVILEEDPAGNPVVQIGDQFADKASAVRAADKIAVKRGLDAFGDDVSFVFQDDDNDPSVGDTYVVAHNSLGQELVFRVCSADHIKYLGFEEDL